MPDNELKFKAAVGVAIVLAVLMGYRLLHPTTTFAADGIDPGWDAAAARSHELGQPSVVLFSAGWCGPCRLLHADVLSREDVRAELNHYSFYTVDLSEPSPAVSTHVRKFGVDAIPLMIRYDANGKETDRANYLDAPQMVAWLKAGE